MNETKNIGAGLRKEIITEYQGRGGGTVVPSAHEDNFGGRPGLDGSTIITNIVDDPSVMDVEENSMGLHSPNRAVAIAASPTLVAQPPSAPALPPPPSPDLPAIFQEEVIKVAQATVPLLAEDLISSLRMELVSLRNELANSHKDVTSQKADGKGAIEVIMVGEFGRFRTKVSDVKICENHIALIYTGNGDDGDMTYEPPPQTTFVVKLQLENGQFDEYHVRHFGLITQLQAFGVVVVVLVKAADPAEPSETSDDKDQHSFPEDDTLLAELRQGSDLNGLTG